MILIVDRRPTDRARDILTILRSDRIPCAFTRPAEFFDHETPMCTVIFSDMDGEVDEIIKNYDKESIIIAVGEHIRDQHKRNSEKLRVVDRIYDLFFVKYGIHLDSVIRGRLEDSRKMCRFGFNIMNFTPAERLILRYIAIVNKEYVTSRELADYCLKGFESINSVPVHIASINKKGYKHLFFPIIDNKRGKGYFLN